MTNRELQLKLRALTALRAGGEPNALWVAQTRASLVEKMRAHDGVVELPIRMPRVGFWPRFMFAMRPVMAVLVLAGFGAFGWLASVSASLGSIPGDPLYSLKTAGERAQLTFVTDSSARAMLHLEFVARRANEVASLAESNDPDRDSNVAIAVGELRKEIDSVSVNLEEVRIAGNAQNSSEVAQAVDRKVAELRVVLHKTKSRLSDNTQKQVNELEAVADGVAVQAVAVLVQTSKQGVGPASADVATRVQETIDAAEQKILVASPEGAEQATAALDAAKAALAKDNLEEAVNKIQESADLVEAKVEVVPVPPKAPSTVEGSNVEGNGQIKAIE
jgi:hypothetical protein